MLLLRAEMTWSLGLLTLCSLGYPVVRTIMARIAAVAKADKSIIFDQHVLFKVEFLFHLDKNLLDF